MLTLANYKAGGWFLHRNHSSDLPRSSSQGSWDDILPAMYCVGIGSAPFLSPQGREKMLQKIMQFDLPFSLPSELGMLRLGASLSLWMSVVSRILIKTRRDGRESHSLLAPAPITACAEKMYAIAKSKFRMA